MNHLRFDPDRATWKREPSSPWPENVLLPAVS
jgi:hypothetical protein